MLLVEVGGQGAVGVRSPNIKWVSKKDGKTERPGKPEAEPKTAGAT